MAASTRVFLVGSSLAGWTLVGGAVLTACAQQVQVTPATPDAGTSEVCSTFVEQLPPELPTVGPQRDVTPDSDLTAAYGDPPVGIRCGVPEPAALTATSLLVTIDGVDWLPEELSAGWRLTTVGRRAGVEITVPAELGPAPSVAADLGAIIAATIPAG